MKKYLLLLLLLPFAANAALTTVPWRYDTTANTYYTYPNITGKVGIGTSSPTSALHILGDTSNDITLNLQQTNTVNVGVEFSATGSNGIWNLGVDRRNTNTATANNFYISNGATLSTNPRFTISTAGNIGIGTTSPWGQLSASSTSAAPTLAVEQHGTGQSIFVTANNTTNVPFFKATNIGAGTSGILLNYAGNGSVNLYNTSASRLQSIYTNIGGFEQQVTGTGNGNAADGAFRLFTDANAAGSFASAVRIKAGASQKLLVGWQSDNTEVFSLGYTGGAYFADSVGIGTTSPAARLSVAGTSGGTTPVFLVSTSTAAFATTTTFVIDQNGNVGIGTNNPTQGFDFFGKLTLRSSDGSLATTGKITSGNITITNQADTIQETTSARQLYLMGGSAAVGAAGAEIDLIGSTNATNPGTIAFRTGTTGSAQGNPIAGFVTAGGSWGIGTTTPASQFTIASTTTATTTVEFGDQYSTNSHACFNTKNTAGTNVSFYFVGTTQVIEPNRCK